MYSVSSAVATGQITPNDAAEISKVVAVTVRAFETAEFANRRDLVKELTLEELELIAVGVTPPRLLTIGRRRFHGHARDEAIGYRGQVKEGRT
jgi:hypothetical protein